MVRMGAAIAAVTLLSVLGMAVSGTVARSIQGSSEAINLAGSLRMQSWHMASLFLARSGNDLDGVRHRIDEAIAAFDATLADPIILSMFPDAEGGDFASRYRTVVDNWHRQIRPRFLNAAAPGTQPTPLATARILLDVGEFVDDINRMIKQMEHDTEVRVQVMQRVLGAALAVTVLVVVLALRLIGVAIGAERRIEQGRRLALLEERAVIARELHDSLAQSLAYMKIQVSRLQGAMNSPDRNGEAAEMLVELREGLSGAYRQLRELLSTFRLKMEGEGLEATLEQTAEEFAGRGALAVELDIAPSGGPLTPHEEIHVLHVIREALSNVVNHARARHAWIRLSRNDEGLVEAVVEDDGMGIREADCGKTHHHGMTIMEERARTLRGEIRYREREGGGTRVVLAFRPAERMAT